MQRPQITRSQQEHLIALFATLWFAIHGPGGRPAPRRLRRGLEQALPR